MLYKQYLSMITYKIVVIVNNKVYLTFMLVGKLYYGKDLTNLKKIYIVLRMQHIRTILLLHI